VENEKVATDKRPTKLTKQIFQKWVLYFFVPAPNGLRYLPVGAWIKLEGREKLKLRKS